ncbi:28S ribosomal protein S30, mitochondrial [Dufourea novaeangliae]|uniref:28S ribosomal protein S30, mitochondrial n=2 Tax=Dufourea novaeangliae TaxID=178035 RepID=A0A154P4Q6_DUFNO|nr:28S ribosomal protein S30, mitochondrial [Dufourea novaeangliae]
MPRYYGWRCLHLTEESIPYNALHHAQYITRTHVMNEHKLPDFYDNLIISEQLDAIVQSLKKPIEDAIIFEHCSRLRKHEITKTINSEKEMHNLIAKSVAYQINRIILSTLASLFPHLMEVEVDFEPRKEAFWFIGGIDPPEILRKMRAGSKFTKDIVDNPVDLPVQYFGSPILQLRHRIPLKEIIPLSEFANIDCNIPKFKLDPRVLGYKLLHYHGTNIPGFWPGDPAEFGLLSYQNSAHLLHRNKAYNDEQDALTVQAIFASYSWLLSQACYQGFSTFNDITYPLVTQTVITDGQSLSFCSYQLNTTLLHSEHADVNPMCNVCWITEPKKLFDAVENEKIHGFNEDVLKTLIKFYINKPEERMGVNLKPYLGESVKHIADIPDDERRTWLEQHFKHLMSNRPRNIPLPEVADWQWIYKIHHKTRPMDKKRDPWEFGFKPSKRRLNFHSPAYIPRCLRENPKKRHIGRRAKTYYPDA